MPWSRPRRASSPGSRSSRSPAAPIGHPILGDPKYFERENWELPGGLQNRLHLLARRIVVPHPRGGTIDVTAPLPPHMVQSWNLLGFDAARYDPIENAPEGEADPVIPAKRASRARAGIYEHPTRGPRSCWGGRPPTA